MFCVGKKLAWGEPKKGHISTGKDGTSTLWDPPTGVVLSFTDKAEEIVKISFMSPGKKLVSQV